MGSTTKWCGPILALGVLALAALAVTPSVAADNGAGPESWIGDLAPIAATDWNYDRAAHLLERTGFGGPPDEIERLAAMTPQQAVDFLVDYQKTPLVELPPFDESGIYPSEDYTPLWNVRAFSSIYLDHVNVSADYLAKTTQGGSDYQFVDALTGVTEQDKRESHNIEQAIVDRFYTFRRSEWREIRRVQQWLATRMMLSNRPLQEKLALFWHGHFATEDRKVNDYRKMIAQYDMLREKGNGHFRDLLISIAQDPAMVFYLDNRTNVKGHPNENFAREIMELFALGVGNYTEKDIQEAARAFTGWTDDGLRFVNRPDLHDDTEKTVLGKTGNFDGYDVVDILLEQDACASFISSRLYRYFVRGNASPELQSALAASLRGSNYNVGEFLKTVFLSRDFYSPPSVATQIKSPAHLVVSTYRKLGLTRIPTAPEFTTVTANMGQEVLNPPNVKGWDAGQTWINPSTLFLRQNFARHVLFPQEGAPTAVDYMPVNPGSNAHMRMGGDGQMMDSGAAAPVARGESRLEKMLDKQVAEGDSPAYDVLDGVAKGVWRANKIVKNDGWYAAEFSLKQMLIDAKVTTTMEAVDHLCKRFLRANFNAEQRAGLATYLEKITGSATIQFETRYALETDLRELLHLILSAPEYQLS